MRGLANTTMLLLAAGGVVVGLAVPAAAHETKHLISGSSIKEHSIAGNRLKANTVTGSQIKESTLGTVPKATTAGTATTAKSATSASSVDGKTIQQFAFTVAANGGTQTVKAPGVTISGNCPSGAVNLDAAGTLASGQTMVVEGADSNGDQPFTGEYNSLTPSSHDDLSPESGQTGGGVGTEVGPGSAVTTIDFSYESAPSGSCIYSGTIIAGT